MIGPLFRTTGFLSAFLAVVGVVLCALLMGAAITIESLMQDVRL